MITDIKKPIPFQDKGDVNIKIIGDYDKNMLNYIGRLYKQLNGDTVDIDDLENIVDVLAKYKQKSEYSYLENLIYPEKAKGCKIPSAIPVPSTSFQLHNSFTLSTNSKGNLAMVCNPFYLYNNTDLESIVTTDSTLGEMSFIPNYYSSFYYNNNESLTGHENNMSFVPLNVGQGIPNVYDQYRLVSASIIAKYIGRMDITSGVIGGAIVFDENQIVGSNGEFIQGGTSTDNFNSIIEWTSKYGNFDLAEDSFYHQENLCLEGLRMLYFPIDNTFEEYTKLGGSSVTKLSHYGTLPLPAPVVKQTEDVNKSGFNWMIYVLGAPPSTSCFKIDIYCNFECLPNASFLNYMPITPSCGYVSPQEKKESITIVQNKPVMKSTETITVSKPNKVNAWKKLKKAFQGALPSIGKLFTKGLIKAIPYMKPGLGIAGTLLEGVSNIANITKNNQLNPNMSIDYEEDVE